jgi:hypothetical protein
MATTLPDIVLTTTERDSLCMEGFDWKVCGKAALATHFAAKPSEMSLKLEESAQELLKNLNRQGKTIKFVLENFSSGITNSEAFIDFSHTH